jgi:hypothetical protein
MYAAGLHAGQNGNGTSQVCPPKKNVQVRCSMGEPHSGQRASAIGELAEMRKSITSADTDFSIGGIGRLQLRSAFLVATSLHRWPSISLQFCQIATFVNRDTVFIGICDFKADRLMAERADRKFRGR